MGKQGKRNVLTRIRQIRLDNPTDDTITELSKELNQDYSKTLREVISIGLMVMYGSDKVTLKDLLIGTKDKLIDETFPFSLSMIEITGDEDEEESGD